MHGPRCKTSGGMHDRIGCTMAFIHLCACIVLGDDARRSILVHISRQTEKSLKVLRM